MLYSGKCWVIANHLSVSFANTNKQNKSNSINNFDDKHFCFLLNAIFHFTQIHQQCANAICQLIAVVVTLQCNWLIYLLSYRLWQPLWFGQRNIHCWCLYGVSCIVVLVAYSKSIVDDWFIVIILLCWLQDKRKLNCENVLLMMVERAGNIACVTKDTFYLCWMMDYYWS